VGGEGHGAHPAYYELAHSIERIAAVHIPTVVNAFRMSGTSLASVCLLWVRQCFWNFLDWPEIVLYGGAFSSNLLIIHRFSLGNSARSQFFPQMGGGGEQRSDIVPLGCGILKQIEN
jgi:hypothetical protein